MMMIPRNILFIRIGGAIAVSLLIGGVLFYLYTDIKKGKVVEPALEEETELSYDENGLPIIPGAVVEEIKEESIAYPSLSIPLPSPKNLSAEDTRKFVEKGEGIKEALKENPNQPEYWNELALMYSAVEDFETSRTITRFLTQKYSTVALYWYNLGATEIFRFKNFELGEKYYLKAISLAPKEESFYAAGAELYGIMGQDEKAVALIDQGLKLLPNSLFLKNLRNAYLD